MTVAGLFVAPTPKVVKKSVISLLPSSDIVTSVMPFDRTQKMQLEYILLWWLGYMPKPADLHRGFKGSTLWLLITFSLVPNHPPWSIGPQLTTLDDDNNKALLYSTVLAKVLSTFTRTPSKHKQFIHKENDMHKYNTSKTKNVYIAQQTRFFPVMFQSLNT